GLTVARGPARGPAARGHLPESLGVAPPAAPVAGVVVDERLRLLGGGVADAVVAGRALRASRPGWRLPGWRPAGAVAARAVCSRAVGARVAGRHPPVARSAARARVLRPRLG